MTAPARDLVSGERPIPMSAGALLHTAMGTAAHPVRNGVVSPAVAEFARAVVIDIALGLGICALTLGFFFAVWVR